MRVSIVLRRTGPLLAATALLAACEEKGGNIVTPLEEWGGFEAAGLFGTGGGGITSIAAGEVTGDGAVDALLVMRAPFPSVQVMPGTAPGFGAAQPLQGLNDPLRATLADVTGDGRLDVLAVGHADNALRVWPSSPGGLGASVAHPLANHGRNLVTGEWSGDARADVAAIHDGSGQPVTLTSFRGAAGGVLEPAWEHRSTSSTSAGACVADLTGDGRADVAVVTGNEAAPVQLYAGAGNATFQPPRALPTLAAAGAHDGSLDVACGDLDGDGRADLVTVHSDATVLSGRNAVTVRRGAADEATFEVAVTEPRDIVLGDFDRDGRLDAVLTHPEHPRLTLLFGRGDGTFATPVPVVLDSPAGLLAVADVNADGWPDLVVAMINGSVRLMRNRAMVPDP